MFSNIGKQIKTLATVLCWIGIIITILLGMFLISFGTDEGLELLVFWGWVIVIGGPIMSYVSSFLLYGFGELIDQTCEINEKLSRTELPSPVMDLTRTEKLEKLLVDGLISEQEYNKAISK